MKPIYLLFFLIITFFVSSFSIHYYESTNEFFGKSDIKNYQKLNQEPDLFHINTFVLTQIFGEKNFFTKIMPIIIFFIFPLSLYQIVKDEKQVIYILLSCGLLHFYFIVGLYSQCIAHIFYNYYLGSNKKRYLVIAVLNHPTVLIAYALMHRKYLYAFIGGGFIWFYYPTLFSNFTVFRADQNIVGMLFILMNPLHWKIKSKYTYNHFIGLLSSNMRISYYSLPYQCTKRYWFQSFIWFVGASIIHIILLVYESLSI